MQKTENAILIIDDAEDIRFLLQELLKRENYKTIVVHSAQEGISILEEKAQKINLILMDVLMPDMNGIEACQKIKSQRKWRDIPVIMVTALNDMEELDRAFSVGAIDYITKPIKKRELLARIRSALALKKEMDQRKAREIELLSVNGLLEDAVEKLKSLSSLDGLTELPNRRRFDEYLEKEWKRAVRNGTKISLIMLDIDYFKAYNDSKGHLSGDECLKKIAHALKQTVQRSADLVCRYGGEEFAVILPETELAGAEQLAEKMRKHIEHLQIEHSSSPLGEVVTISVGVATEKPETYLTWEELIFRADQALYKAKGAGRNTVITATEIN
ncbi:diguanylate cyclase [Heliorestis acidaminivorans]|uniref:Stage 0 sporulation protein A homolog n=1 Tax=Heliorestis acidaminivorans TaxID=553427 RepID=A0A6I0F325_9FIRM|nr:diguanylate cyclase [Heliorestis acidaminivorans]KAB2952881.1 diguanylate cyclase [Heliorestis acidaminivorans]